MPLIIRFLLIYETYLAKHDPCNDGYSGLANWMEKFYYFIVDSFIPVPKTLMYKKEASGKEFDVNVRCPCSTFWRGVFITTLFFVIVIGVYALVGMA